MPAIQHSQKQDARKLDAIVIGAGVSGLAALADLDRAGLHAVCLEARGRIGGRIFTHRDPLSPLPIELGAEFVHGRPPETWQIVDAAGLIAYDCTEDAVHVENGAILHNADAWLPVDEVMNDMQHAAESGPDQSFAAFLAGSRHPVEAKKIAKSYVEGFNAADAARIGIASLAVDVRASDAIDGDRSFRIMNGYDSIPEYLFRGIRDPVAALRLHSIVQRIEWRKDSSTVYVRSGSTQERQRFESPRLIVTVPLGVLQTAPGQLGAIEFSPVPFSVMQAAKKMCFGQVVRMILRFRERIWEQKAELSDIGFLLSDEPVFPTWWTPLPIRSPIVTGWSAGPKGDALLQCDRADVVSKAIQSLARITAIGADSLHASLEAAYFHDWFHDPFARGAYSYVPVDGLSSREILSKPVDGTLFFAGEATETEGHGATVHGAIASGRRAARQVLESYGKF